MININKKLKKAKEVYEKWLSQQSDKVNLEVSVEVFMSHYLYQDLLKLSDVSAEELGAYVKVFYTIPKKN